MQHAVSRSATKTAEAHDIADPQRFVDLVTREVVATMPSEGSYDGNMRVAVVTSYVLALWYFRLHRAKCWHPDRPLEARRGAYQQWLTTAQAFALLPVDERDDYTFMPQEWDNPFLPGARSGKFV